LLTLTALALVLVGSQAMAADAAIRKHRMGTLTIHTAPGAAVAVTQLQHEFWFGTAISWVMFKNPEAPDSKRYLDVLKANFNSAVHENALKWYHTEKQGGGTPDYSDPDRMVAWCEANGIRTRGHCIFWCVDRYVQKWLRELDDAALREAVERRGREVTSRYRGRIPEYDVNNEMMHARYFRKRLGEGVLADMFRLAREGDPKARLYVNDYGVLHSGGAAYAKHIQGLLGRGLPVGGIGIQGHTGGHVDARRLKATLDALARFRLPIKITEFDLNTKDEQAKARGLETLYRVCFAHPAVDGILLWGFWAGRHWRPAAALWKRDWTPTPAAETHRRLVLDEWWTRWRGRADAWGRCELRVFFGTHRVEAGGKSIEVTLSREEGSKKVRVAAQ
jgi:GH35 family endo-1,4-beta-xylanase